MHLSAVLAFVFAAGIEGLRVNGPSGPVMAQLGGSVLLPCFTESPVSPEDLQVRWRKMGSESTVSLFQEGKSRPDLQSQEFRGRVDFFPDEILNGNFSIVLRHVVKEDAGSYRCSVNTTKDSSEVMMELQDKNRFEVTGADDAVFTQNGGTVMLHCSVDSGVAVSEIEEVTWKKTDGTQEILVLLYQDGTIIPESTHERYQGRVDLFSSEIPKGNFSLKLMDVKIEDKGEYTCEIHTSDMSARVIVVLQGVGFSALHILILVLCFVSLLLALGFCGPVFNLLRNKDTSRKAVIIHISLILCPNICLFVAFILWRQEGHLPEVVTCATVSIMRILLLMKTSTCLHTFPQCLQKVVKSLAVPVYHLSVTVGAGSFFLSTMIIELVLACIAVLFAISAVVLGVYGFQMHQTLCLEIVIALFGGLVLDSHYTGLNYTSEMGSVVPTLIVLMMMVLSLQRHLFQGKPFERVYLTLSSVIMTIFCLIELLMYGELVLRTRNFVIGWMFIFVTVLMLLTWIGVACLLRHPKKYQQRCCSQRRKIGYFCCSGLVAFLIIVLCAMSLRYISNVLQNKDRDGSLVVAALIYVLTATSLFKHPKCLPYFLHTVIYMFAAVGFSIVYAVALASELILKAGKGSRTTQDLRVIVLSFETVFVSTWLILQIYSSWKELQDRINHNFEEESVTRPEEPEEIQIAPFLGDQ